MVAAGFTAGEADRLRRAIGSWRKHGELPKFRLRLLEGMAARGYSREFAEQIYRQIEGFGEYGFPESHAASFALLAYASAWLKRHEPAAFLCALLNSYPMGFYAPAQLIQDAVRHGVEVRPVDVNASDWACTLEGEGAAVRVGLRYVKGLTRAAAERLVAARAQRPFGNVRELVQRTALDRGDTEALAGAGALAVLAGDRHQARWQVLGVEAPPPLFADDCAVPPRPAAAVPLPAPSEGEDLVADYAHLGFTLGRHPLALLRQQLQRRRSVTAARIRELPHGTKVHYVGLVTIRQRPGSASGVIFITLEDETGTTNAIVWPALIERYRKIVVGARLLGIHGEVQREGEVIHLVAHRLEDHTGLLGQLSTESRDFH
jgi:error-prone DNA polymerase